MYIEKKEKKTSVKIYSFNFKQEILQVSNVFFFLRKVRQKQQDLAKKMNLLNCYGVQDSLVLKAYANKQIVVTKGRMGFVIQQGSFWLETELWG